MFIKCCGYQGVGVISTYTAYLIYTVSITVLVFMMHSNTTSVLTGKLTLSGKIYLHEKHIPEHTHNLKSDPDMTSVLASLKTAIITTHYTNEYFLHINIRVNIKSFCRHRPRS